MELKPSLFLEGSEPLSKALDGVLSSRLAVIITKNGLYSGLIDDRHLKTGIPDLSKIKSETVMVKAPVISMNCPILERLNAFLAGHYKSIPVVDSKNKPLGVYTRADLIKELLALRAYPAIPASDLMNSPVYSIDYQETVNSAKKLMKEKNSSRLLVTKSGYPYGLMSSFDLAALEFTRPRKSKDVSPTHEIRDVEARKIEEFLRENLTLLPEDSKLQDAMKTMADKQVSSLILCDSNKKPRGVLSATDIFKRLVEIANEGPQIVISGLSGDDLSYFDYVKSSLDSLVKKFSKSFEITEISFHSKKGKSTHDLHLHFKVNNSPFAVSAEGFSLKEAVDELCKETHNILNKKREKDHLSSKR